MIWKNFELYQPVPFPGTGCPIPDVDYLCLLCIDFYVWDAVSIFNHLPRMFLSTDFAFRITDWTCCHGPHFIYVWNQWFFYSVITFSYTKCFVHSYTIDVVFTLSYHHTLNAVSLCKIFCISFWWCPGSLSRSRFRSRERDREKEREIKFIGLFADREHQGPHSPYKPYNHNLYIGMIIFPHIDNPQSTAYD